MGWKRVLYWSRNRIHGKLARLFARFISPVKQFGEQYRPCRLSRFIYGFPRKNQNEFSFDRSLDYRLLPLLSAHADNKPSLIFCSTRKGKKKKPYCSSSPIDKI